MLMFHMGKWLKFTVIHSIVYFDDQQPPLPASYCGIMWSESLEMLLVRTLSDVPRRKPHSEWKSGSSQICCSARCQGPTRGANYLLGDLLENYASNPDDSEQETADKPGWCHHFLPQEVSRRGRRGLWQVDKIKGLGTSPLSFLLVFPLGIISRNVLVLLFQQWLVFFGLDSLLKSVDKTLPKGPSKLWGLFLYTAALGQHNSTSRHSQYL